MTSQNKKITNGAPLKNLICKAVEKDIHQVWQGKRQVGTLLKLPSQDRFYFCNDTQISHPLSKTLPASLMKLATGQYQVTLVGVV